MKSFQINHDQKYCIRFCLMIVRGGPGFDIILGCPGVGVQDHVGVVIDVPGRPVRHTLDTVLGGRRVAESCGKILE